MSVVVVGEATFSRHQPPRKIWPQMSEQCKCSRDGLHENTIIGSPYSAMTYTACTICGEREERGMGAFYGLKPYDPPSLEQRVRALEEKIFGPWDGRCGQ